ncbi:uncharacterized protein LOC143236118 [Tachypleus tridentatus]|uniref:uncharacterized protein LOC143236118 n=1 Tax=Tachypleus tridentatus TaxID=6853 RepID=UPI003FD18304
MEVQLVVLRESLPQCCSRIAMAVSGGSLICPTGRLRKARNSRGAGFSSPVDNASEVVGNVSPKVYGTLLLLPLIFGEDKEDLFKTAEDIITSADLEQHDDLPHPHVVIRGNHPFENNCYAVVEGCILAENVTLRMAVGLTIAAYYNLNITYPESIANTLEFIQRIFLGINPQRGSS